MLRTQKIIIINLSLVIIANYAVSLPNGIIFPDDAPPELGDRCSNGKGVEGTCQKLQTCPSLLDLLIKREIHFGEVKCEGSRDALVCCPPAKGIITTAILDITEPKSASGCGGVWKTSGFGLGLEDLRDFNTNIPNIASRMKLSPLATLLENKPIAESTKPIPNLTKPIPNLTKPINKIQVAGGINANIIFTVYMALLGTKGDWFCDGVLINNAWVLTSAHCFGARVPTHVRLGEYNLNNDRGRNGPALDFLIDKIEIYPEYKFPSAHHDLALVKLTEEPPSSRPDIKPICLPWGEESSLDIINKTVTLTGWGATQFLGPSSPILQEANVTVFDPSVCDKSYSRLRDYSEKFPNGITKENSVCAGDVEGGKDACQGDSGGPIVYLDNKGRFTLAGIVSTGNGCGLKEFPGIYAPLHNAKYLAWIKRIAFAKS